MTTAGAAGQLLRLADMPLGAPKAHLYQEALTCKWGFQSKQHQRSRYKESAQFTVECVYAWWQDNAAAHLSSAGHCIIASTSPGNYRPCLLCLLATVLPCSERDASKDCNTDGSANVSIFNLR